MPESVDIRLDSHTGVPADQINLLFNTERDGDCASNVGRKTQTLLKSANSTRHVGCESVKHPHDTPRHLRA